MKLPILVLIAIGLSACTHESKSVAPAQLKNQDTVRIATFNVSMYRKAAGGLIASLSGDEDDQIRAVANIIETVDPDILLINEFDYDKEGRALELFQGKYLNNKYNYTFVAPSNTGISTGLDLDNSGKIVTTPGEFGYGNDSFGYGDYEGQYAFAIVSKYPIATDNIRTFQNFRWANMPENLMPTDWYNAASQKALRLSSKNHVDAPIKIGDKTIHILASHPTPPTFDGPEDRNGRRNHDEIRMIADYLDPTTSCYLVDDNGVEGGLEPNAQFVIMGDLNADPFDGDSYNNAINQLLTHERVADTRPKSTGAVSAAEIAKGANDEHKSPHNNDTADFRDINDDGTNAVGNLRLDYVLPSKNLSVTDSGVYWPGENEAGYDFVGPGYPPISSDHRLVWIDVKLD